MLILTRKKGEGIAIGDSIAVHVVRISGKKVRLGVTAPNSVPVHRNEIAERLKTLAEDAIEGRKLSGFELRCETYGQKLIATSGQLPIAHCLSEPTEWPAFEGAINIELQDAWESRVNLIHVGITGGSMPSHFTGFKDPYFWQANLVGYEPAARLFAGYAPRSPKVIDYAKYEVRVK